MNDNNKIKFVTICKMAFLECPACRKKFRTGEKLDKHIITQDHIASDFSEPWTCAICGFKSSIAREVADHAMVLCSPEWLQDFLNRKIGFLTSNPKQEITKGQRTRPRTCKSKCSNHRSLEIHSENNNEVS